RNSKSLWEARVKSGNLHKISENLWSKARQNLYRIVLLKETEQSLMARVDAHTDSRKAEEIAKKIKKLEDERRTLEGSLNQFKKSVLMPLGLEKKFDELLGGKRKR
ncbi:MAG: hypothetical protein ABIE23_01235, partial [archaeon]